jgi:hypothetical protein
MLREKANKPTDSKAGITKAWGIKIKIAARSKSRHVSNYGVEC